MKTIYKIICSSIYLYSFNTQAQQVPSFMQYSNSFNLVNPAYVGSPQSPVITANIRSKFVNIENAPKIQAFSLHSPVGDNVGLGFSVINDKVFVLGETHLFADFSYTINLARYSNLAFGIKAGGSFLNVDLLSLNITDDMLFSQNVNEFNPNVGTGAYYYTSNFFLSVSATNLLKNERYERTNGVVTSNPDATVWFAATGYRFDFSDTGYRNNFSDFALKPSIMVRALKGNPLAIDLSTLILWRNKVEFGVSYRINDSIAGIFQFRFSDYMKIGYSYNVLTNNHSDFNSGSHEFNLSYNISILKNNRRKLRTPFYF